MCRFLVGEGGHSPLFTHDLYDEFTGSRTGIKIYQNDLLPGAKSKLPLDYWNGEGWSLQLPPQMGMPIVFARVFCVVLPIGFGRDGGIPKVLCVGSNTWLVFDDHDGGRGMLDKQRQGPVQNTCLT